VRLSAPTRERRSIHGLIRVAIEGEALRLAGESFGRVDRRPGRRFVANREEGFTGLSLRVLQSQPVSDRQSSLEAPQASEADLARLIDTLRARMSSDEVMRVRLIESHLPEHAWRLAPIEDQRAGDDEPGVGDAGDVAAPRSAQAAPNEVVAAPMALPTRVFAPVEARVTVCPSHDADGRPVQIVLDGRAQAVTHAIGPHRVEGLWWQGHDKSRDYFDIELSDARRLWIFRVRPSGRWFVHGDYG
jgi:protein ImuB